MFIAGAHLTNLGTEASPLAAALLGMLPLPGKSRDACNTYYGSYQHNCTVFYPYGSQTQLADCLYRHGLRLFILGQHQKASVISQEAVITLQRLLPEYSDQYTSQLADCLCQLGQHQEASEIEAGWTVI